MTGRVLKSKAAADVHHHGAGGLGHGQVSTHGRGHGLLDEVGLAGGVTYTYYEGFACMSFLDMFSSLTGQMSADMAIDLGGSGDPPLCGSARGRRSRGQLYVARPGPGCAPGALAAACARHAVTIARRTSL